MNRLASSLWVHASDHFTTTELQSHAVALFCVYVFWYYNWHLPTQKIEQEANEEIMVSQATDSDSPGKVVGDNSNNNSKKSDYDDATTRTSSSTEESPSVISTTSSEAPNRIIADEAVAEACPDATPVERERFLIARNWDIPSAISTLTNYLDWNDRYESIAKQHNLVDRRNITTSDDDDNADDDDNDIDRDIWVRACRIAMKASGEEGSDDDKSGSGSVTNLPRVIRTYKNNKCANGGNIDDNHCRAVTDADGYRIFHILPAQMDHNLAQGSTYALATALFINLHLDRSKAEKITVCMDIRAGQGWPNIHAIYQIPFMKDTTTLLLSLFPERLHKCLVYPIPSSFTWIWTIVSKIIDQRTVDKIGLLAGPSRIISPPPMEEMEPVLGQEVAEFLEQARIDDFITE